MSKGQYLYTGFVDFRIVFNSVWGEGLMHKLGKTGITGTFLKVVNSAHKSPYVSLIFKDKTTKPFPTWSCNKNRNNM